MEFFKLKINDILVISDPLLINYYKLEGIYRAVGSSGLYSIMVKKGRRSNMIFLNRKQFYFRKFGLSNFFGEEEKQRPKIFGHIKMKRTI